jgi:hypothetical protein
MKYQLLTTDNRTLFVEYYLLEQFYDYILFIKLQYIFTIIPIPIPTYSYNYMKFIFFLVEFYHVNPIEIECIYEAENGDEEFDDFYMKRQNIETSNFLQMYINWYIRDCIKKNKICDCDKIDNDLNNIRAIIIKLDDPIIICMIEEYLKKFFADGIEKIPDWIKEGVNNTSSIF